MPEGPQVRYTGNLIAKYAKSDITSIEYPKSRPAWPLRFPVQIDHVEVKGKNIFIYLDSGQVIYNHLLMWGSWLPGSVHYRGKRLNTLFHTVQGDLGYFGGGIIKLVLPEEAQQIKAKLGIDLVDAKDAEEAFEEVKKSAKPIGEAIVDQHLVAGIGNIYKSEGMFVGRIHPLRPANRVTEKEYERMFNFLKPQMIKDSMQHGAIVTTTIEAQKAGNSKFVYKRMGRPCLVCGTKIERIYQGSSLKRSTYFCPRCQAT